MQSVKSFYPSYNLIAHHRKAYKCFHSYSIIDLNAGLERAVIHLYQSGSGARDYARLWVYSHDAFLDATGSGMAGGSGYHRPSAAAQVAFEEAGITLSEPIDGRGESAIKDAMRALADYLPVKRYMILHAHA